MTPTQHAAQVAMVKASMLRRPTATPPNQPEHDMAAHRYQRPVVTPLPRDPNAWARFS